MASQEGRNTTPDSFRELFEQSRLEDLNLFSIAIRHVLSGVTVADARDPELPLIYVNPGFENITGYSADEAIGRSCRFLQGEERDQPGLEILRKALQQGEPCKVRLRNYRKDGTLFYNELQISPVRNSKGVLTHFVGIQLDVTERVRARESLERSEQQMRMALQREAELNAIKSRFISMVSHEFRTPMTGMRSSASFLRKYGDRLGKQKMDRHLLNIETSLKRMNRLLDDVLFFSRSEADKINVEPQEVVIADYISMMIESIENIYPDRTIHLKNLLPDGTVCFLDPHLLDHICHNLISNAFKYSSADSPVELIIGKNFDLLEITVTDQGIGIPMKDHEHLFEAFHRAENVGARQGTGLGLNIALRAAELLGGTMTFTSEQGTGSSFFVNLPMRITPDTDYETDSPYN